MPNSEDKNPFESVSPEIVSSLNSCNQFYLRSVILQVLFQYPELTDSVQDLLSKASADQGRDKIAIGLGDICCRAKRSVFFVSYSSFAETIRTHGIISSANTTYDAMMKANCLIIDDFAGIRIYDEDLLDGITQFIAARANAHKESYIQHKYNSKKPFVPCSTIATSSFEPVDWVKQMDQHEKKTYALARFFYQSYAAVIHVDETNMPSPHNK